MCTRRRRQRGFTLVESIVFIVIIAIAVGGLLGVFNVANRGSADPVQRKQAQMIAEALLEEVMLARMTWCDPGAGNYDEATSAATCAANGATAEGWGPEAGNARPFDNVNDYVSGGGVAEAAFNSGANLVDANGSIIGGGSYSATLTVTPVALNDIALGTAGAADNNAFELKVTVSYGSQSLTLTGYRTRYAPQDR
jgi:MSHA pilin protein MshD